MNSTTNPHIIKPAGEITSTTTTQETPQTPSGALVSAPAAQPWYKQRKAQIGMAAAAVAVVAACVCGVAVAADTGSVNKDTIDKVTNNAAAGADARNSKTDEEKKDAQDAAKQDTQNAQESAGGNASSSTGGQTVQTGASGGSASSGGSTGGSSSADSAPAPTHTHSWQPVYRTVHHDAVTEQVQEPVYGEVMICTDCGAVNPTREHSVEHMRNGGSGGCYGSSAQTGTKTVTKVVTSAYDEQVLDHYVCSCGAAQ